MILKSLTSFKASLKEEKVNVDEISKGDEVIIREMSTRRMLAYQEAMKHTPQFSVEHLIIACMVDEDGKQSESHDNAELLSELLPVTVSNRLIEACNRVNESLFVPHNSKKKK